MKNLTLVEALQGLKEKKFSSTELTKEYLKRIEEKNPEVNAFITVIEKEITEKKAKEIDESRLRKEKLGLLAGLPIAIKDNILIEDVLCTAGSKILSNYKASYDATVIKKLKEADAIFLGKTNMDEFAMGSSTETSYFGPVKNPRDLTRVPGGSSGGSAAAVAAEMCPAALGADTGGSIRQPASFCGVVGLKPTYGRVSRFGLIAMASSLDQIGPLTQTVDDAALLLKVIEGKDIKDSTTQNAPFEAELKEKNLSDFKIGIPKEYFVEGLDSKVKEVIEKNISLLQKKGARIKKVSLPHTKVALPCYYLIMVAEISANLARFDGIRYGLCQKAKDLLEVYLETRTKGFGEEVRRRILLGVYALSAGYYDAYYLKAQKVRTLIKQDFDRVFKEVNCLMTPVSPTPAFKLKEKVSDPLAMYLSDIYTVPVNLAGLPAISLPIGKVNNLPVGLQIIGPAFREDIILSLGKIIEKL